MKKLKITPNNLKKLVPLYTEGTQVKDKFAWVGSKAMRGYEWENELSFGLFRFKVQRVQSCGDI